MFLGALRRWVPSRAALRLRFAAATWAAIAFIIAVGCAYSIVLDYHATIDGRLALVRDVARVVEEHSRSVIAGADMAAVRVAEMVAARGDVDAFRSSAGWETFIGRVGHVAGAPRVSIHDADGNVALDSIEYPSEPRSIGDDGCFKEALVGWGARVCAAVLSDRGGIVEIPVMRPIRNQAGKAIGVVVAALDAELLARFQAHLDFNLNPLISIVRGNGELVARTPQPRRYLGARVWEEEEVRRRFHEEDGFVDFESSLDHRLRFGAYRVIPEYDLVVIVGLARDDALAEWRSRSLRAAAVTAASLVLVFIVLSIAGRMRRHAERADRALTGEIRRRATAEAELAASRIDHLTGVASRRAWLEAARRAGERVDRRFAVLFIDLDDFKHVNDELGHEEGDAVLREAAGVLRGAVGTGDLVGRFGGDEFVIFTLGEEATLRSRVEETARDIVRGVSEIGRGVGCTVGAAIRSGGDEALWAALRDADRAMYEAKKRGKGSFEVAG